MEFIAREQVINDLQQSFQSYMERFGIEDIGIFEEEGQDDQYFLGLTVSKEGKTYHVHAPYKKDRNGGLAPMKQEWTVESADPQEVDLRGFTDLESVFREI